MATKRSWMWLSGDMVSCLPGNTLQWLRVQCRRLSADMQGLPGNVSSCLRVQCRAVSERRRSRDCIACRQSRHDISASQALLTDNDDACRVNVTPAVWRRNHSSNFSSSPEQLPPTDAVRPTSDVYTRHNSQGSAAAATNVVMPSAAYKTAVRGRIVTLKQ